MPAARAMVGRGADLAAIDSAFTLGARGVVLAGPAGVGKTRLARQVLARAERRGLITFWVSASRAAATIPFGALAHLVPDLGTSDRLRLLHRAERWLAAASPDRPALLGVDDAHDLDDASATLVGRLAASGVATVVATVRVGELVPDPVTALWKDARGERIELGPLGRADSDQLAALLLDGPVEAVTREELWRLGQGNPLYLHELVRGGVASGRFVRRDGVWCSLGRIEATPHLVALVRPRVDELPAPLRDAVDLVAFGEPLSIGLLERAGSSEIAVAEAEEAGLLYTEVGATDINVRLAHPLFGEAARARATPLHVRRLCRRLALAASADTDPVRVATWHLDGGVPDASIMLRGAERALAALDLPLAQRLAEGAGRTGPGRDGESLLARIVVLRGDGDRAEELLHGLDLSALPDREHADLAGWRAWNLAFGLGRPAEAEAVLDATGRVVLEGHELLDVERAVIHGYAGRVGAALALTSSIVERPETDPRAALRAWTLTCQMSGVRGRFAEARHAVARASALHRELYGDDWSMAGVEILGGSAEAHLFAGDLDAAQEVAERGSRQASVAGWRAGTAMWLSWHADVAVARGAVRSALGHVREAAALADRDPQPYLGWMSRYRSLQPARVTAMLGYADEAAEALAEAARRDDGTSGVLDVWGGSSAAWVAVAHGDISRGIDTALAAAERARRDDQFAWELLALHQAVRFGAPERAVGRLCELGEHVDGRLAPLIVRHAEAAAAADGSALDGVAAAFAELGCLLLAAEAYAQAAAAQRAPGHTRPATASLRWAHAYAARCEGVATPALARLAWPDGLTRREDEIARLAASGLTNRTIAKRLVISIRTVDNTLRQVYVKLGVRGRSELAPVFDSARQWTVDDTAHR